MDIAFELCSALGDANSVPTGFEKTIGGPISQRADYIESNESRVLCKVDDARFSRPIGEIATSDSQKCRESAGDLRLILDQSA